jgi:uncharacterized protein (TIGR02646 family)
MITIHKEHEPSSLTQHRVSTPYPTYDGLPAKAKKILREALVKEQRGICCYCMRGIADDDGAVKIEHWQSQAHYPEKQLTYKNMLAACSGGGKGQPVSRQHCDTRKRERALKFNPANIKHQVEKRVRYTRDGSISSPDAEFNAQLNDVLGLNLAALRNARKSILDGLLDWCEHAKVKHNGSIPREALERRLEKLSSLSTSSLKPYGPVELWWLERLLIRRK